MVDRSVNSIRINVLSSRLTLRTTLPLLTFAKIRSVTCSKRRVFGLRCSSTIDMLDLQLFVKKAGHLAHCSSPYLLRSFHLLRREFVAKALTAVEIILRAQE